MHRRLLELLETARGESQLVAAVFLDIRGFTSYAGHAESAEAAIFLRKLYLRIANDFFPEAAFLKPTGDGLMIIHCFEEKAMGQVTRDLAETCMKVVTAFRTMFDDDAMLDDAVPRDLGAGLAIGAATRLVADDITIDYSGRPLNLAARLMDLARPSGLVLDRRARLALGESMGELELAEDEVYVKGVAEDSPMTIAYSSQLTSIPDRYHNPIGQYEWVLTSKFSETLSAFRKRSGFLFPLDSEPSFPEKVRLHISYPTPMAGGKKHPKMRQQIRWPGKYCDFSDGRYLRVDCGALAAHLKDLGVKETWTVDGMVEYQVPRAAI